MERASHNNAPVNPGLDFRNFKQLGLDAQRAEGKSKLLAKYTKAGVLLYAKGDSPTFWDRLSGSRARKEALAKDLILEAFEAEFKNSSGPEANGAETLITNIVRRLGRSAMKVDQLLILHSVVAGTVQGHAARDASSPAPAPTSSDKPPATDEPERAGRKSRAKSILNALRKFSNAGVNVVRLANDAKKTYEFKPIKVNDVFYRPVKFVGSGAFGDVFLFRSDSGHELAFKAEGKGKVHGKSAEEIHELFRKEVKLHSEVQSKVPGIVECHGLIQSGEVSGIVTEFCHGDLLSLAGKLARSVDSGQIDPNVARVVRATLLKDAAEIKSRLLANDFDDDDDKSPNYLIGADGWVKKADLGAVRNASGDEINYREVDKSVENPRWQSPERLFTGETGGKLDKWEFNRLPVEYRDLKHKAAEWDQKIMAAFSGLTNRDKKSLTGHILHASVEKAASELNLNRSQEASWVLGMIARDIVQGKQFMEEKKNPDNPLDKEYFNIDIIKDIELYRAGGDPKYENVLVDAQDEPFNGILGGLLNRDPQSRLAVDDALKHAVFQIPGTGSPEVRNLIKALSTGANVAELETHNALVLKISRVETSTPTAVSRETQDASSEAELDVAALEQGAANLGGIQFADTIEFADTLGKIDESASENRRPPVPSREGRPPLPPDRSNRPPLSVPGRSSAL